MIYMEASVGPSFPSGRGELTKKKGFQKLYKVS